MAALSDVYETEVLEWLFTGTTVTRPTSFYIGLFTADPTDADTGTEVSGGSYAREAATFSVTGDTATTTAAIDFTTATASWGTITHIGIYDASTAGNLIAHAALDTAKAIDTGDIFRIPTGDLEITLD